MSSCPGIEIVWLRYSMTTASLLLIFHKQFVWMNSRWTVNFLDASSWRFLVWSWFIGWLPTNALVIQRLCSALDLCYVLLIPGIGSRFWLLFVKLLLLLKSNTCEIEGLLASWGCRYVQVNRKLKIMLSQDLFSKPQLLLKWRHIRLTQINWLCVTSSVVRLPIHFIYLT